MEKPQIADTKNLEVQVVETKDELKYGNIPAFDERHIGDSFNIAEKILRNSDSDIYRVTEDIRRGKSEPGNFPRTLNAAAFGNFDKSSIFGNTATYFYREDHRRKVILDLSSGEGTRFSSDYRIFKGLNFFYQDKNGDIDFEHEISTRDGHVLSETRTMFVSLPDELKKGQNNDVADKKLRISLWRANDSTLKTFTVNTNVAELTEEQTHYYENLAEMKVDLDKRQIIIRPLTGLRNNEMYAYYPDQVVISQTLSYLGSLFDIKGDFQVVLGEGPVNIDPPQEKPQYQPVRFE